MYNIIYSDKPVRYLGVFFTTDLSKLFELNYIPKLQKFKDILHIWSNRDLTPYGKIAIVKSLGLSQLIFILSVLPNPPQHFIKELESVIYKFIWSGKPEKVKRLTLIADYKDGGLRMCHIISIIKGLKIAWVKRVLDANNNGKWKIFFDHHLKQFGGNLLWYCNLNPADKIIGKIKNNFIREVVYSWCTIVYEADVENPCNQIIWNNSFIKTDNNVLYNAIWYNKGIKFVKDLMDNHGNFLSLKELADKFSLGNFNFMDYFSLIYSIPVTWKNKIKDANESTTVNSQSDLVVFVCKTKKVCKAIQQMCIKQIFKPPVVEGKWSMILNNVDLNWAEIFIMPLKATLSIKLRYFQFQFVYRFLPVNKFLYDIRAIDSNLCTFCKKEAETLHHLFWNCIISQKFWQDFQILTLKNTFNITYVNICFGTFDPLYKYYNFAILHANYYLYCCRCKDRMPNIHHFTNVLKLSCAAEREIALGKDKLELWNKKWNVLNL